MFTKSVLLAPLGALILVAGVGCGGAATGPEEGAPAAEETTAPSPVTQSADEATKPADNVGKTQQSWVGYGYGYPGMYGLGYGGYGLGYGRAYGLGYGAYGGYGLGYPGNINGGFNRIGPF
jgi:hypothetical protein